MDPIANQIYHAVKEKMEESGETTYEAYEELFDETMDELKDSGELTDDDNEEFIREQVIQMWDVYGDKLEETLIE